MPSPITSIIGSWFVRIIFTWICPSIVWISLIYMYFFFFDNKRWNLFHSFSALTLTDAKRSWAVCSSWGHEALFPGDWFSFPSACLHFSFSKTVPCWHLDYFIIGIFFLCCVWFAPSFLDIRVIRFQWIRAFFHQRVVAARRDFCATLSKVFLESLSSISTI